MHLHITHTNDKKTTQEVIHLSLHYNGLAATRSMVFFSRGSDREFTDQMLL